jgi:hypothetical protein
LSYLGGGLSSSRVTLLRPTTSFTTTPHKISPQRATSLAFRREVRSINVVLIRPCTSSKVLIPLSLTLIKELVTQQIWCFLRLPQGRNLESLIIKEAILLPPSCRPRYQRTSIIQQLASIARLSHLISLTCLTSPLRMT